jgi:hypothetical protein
MLNGAENRLLYPDYYELIQDVGTKQAYSYLVGWASSLRHYDCLPSSHGVIPDFRFIRGSEWEFAFIPNQKWLLFYFRKPSRKYEKYSRSEIMTRFPETKENNGGEFTVKISTLSEAVKLAEYIES